MEASWILKHVGNQYLDNTQSNDRLLKKYTVNNLLFTYKLNFKNVKDAKITLLVNNIFDTEYINRAWVYRFISEKWNPLDSDPYINEDSDGYNMIGNFPQAKRNYMLGVTLGF